MTGSPGSPEPDESPEIEDVRRLLAQARHTEPMPADVVARMDDALAGLRKAPSAAAAEASSGSSQVRDDGPVVSLAGHRRRRAAGLLVAAAAIVVGGVVLGQNLPRGSSDSASSADSRAQENAAGAAKPHRSPGPNTFGQDGTTAKSGNAVVQGGRLLVRPRRFSDDARAGQRLLNGTKKPDSLAPAAASCASVPTGEGEVLGATYRRAPAALLYRPVSGGSQVVDLYLCGSSRPVRSATLPAP